MYARRKYRRTIRTPRYGKYANRRSRKGYNAQQRSQAMVVTTSRTSNSANRVGGDGLDKISTGRFRNLPTLWPDRFMCKMKYLDTVNTTLTIGQSQQTAFTTYRVNSLYDPLVTTSSEQNVAGFSEMAAMYTNYRVHAAKFTVNIVPNANNNQGAIAYCGFSATTPGIVAGSSYTAVLNSLGNPYTVWSMLAAQAGQATNLENYVGMKKLAGSIVANTDDDYASVANTNPAKPLYGLVLVSVPVVTTAAVSFTSVVEIEFWAEFYGRQYEYY